MNRQFAPNFEILLKNHSDKISGLQPTDYISIGDCYLTYAGNFLIIEKVTNPTETSAENRFTPINLDEIKTFRFTYELKAYGLK